MAFRRNRKRDTNSVYDAAELSEKARRNLNRDYNSASRYKDNYEKAAREIDNSYASRSATPKQFWKCSFAWALGTVAVLSIGVFLFWLWGLNIIHWFTTQWRESTPFWLGAIVTLILTSLFVSYQGESFRKAVFFGVSAVVMILVTIFLTITADYFRLNQVYNQTAEKMVDSDAPSYEERAPFEVAVLTAEKALLNTTGDADHTKSLPELGETGEWNTLVRTRGPFAGYESVQNLTLPLYGTPTNQNVKFCEFNSKNTLRNSGSLPHNNLSRATYGKVPLNVDYDAYDIYSYCDEDNVPIVVVPSKQINGFLHPTWSYYGVATYNGETGAIEVITDTDEINEIPGSVYPETLAAMQRTSITASGDLWTSVFMSAAGYETATNNSDVKLKETNNENIDYVTTLSPRGSSTSIVAVSTITANKAPAQGTLNPMFIHELPENHIRPANSTLVDDISTRYAYKPDIASGTVYVFEITSGKDGGWVASIGKEQSVNYRAYITADGKITLYDRNGNLIPQQGEESNPDNEEPSTDTPVVTPGEKPLEELSNEELQELGEAILKELAERTSN